MARRRQQRKKISKFEFTRKRQHLLRFLREPSKDKDEMRWFRRYVFSPELQLKEMKGGLDNLHEVYLCPP